MHIQFARRRLGLASVVGGALLLLTILVLAACSPSVPKIPSTVSGVVSDKDGPVAGAQVQIKGTANTTTTGHDGSFSFSGAGLGKAEVTTITAWSPGNYVGYIDMDPKKPSWQPDGTGVAITMKPLYTVDNNKYAWFSFEGVSGSRSCGLCHREYNEWSKDAHSQSATNQRFITIYRGTNVKGEKGQTPQLSKDGATTLPPDPTKPYYGPGYRLDNPSRAGNCATCHTPLASSIPNQKNCGWSGCHNSITSERGANVMDPGVMPVSLSGIAAEGVACEFCHKVGEVIMNPKTGLPYPDMPGILSMKLYRPPGVEQVFFGTILDVNRRVAVSPLETQSEFCAPCHYGQFGGVVGMGEVKDGTLIYNSYGEWLESSYSDPKTGKTCQECHMPVSTADWFVFKEKGGISRDYAKLHNHTMTGVTDENLMKNAVSLQASANRGDGVLQVKISVTNDKTGHAVPTDSPTRSVMLVVAALDANGKVLALKEGPALPTWTGNYAGQPGKAYAKVLKDNWTGETPTAAYWRPVTIVEDTRLFPAATDTSEYKFDLPAGSPATVKVMLVYRRAFQLLQEQKGWNDPDLTMAETTISVEK
jgi:hypothetical protein